MGDQLGDLEHVVLLAVARLGDVGYGVSIREEVLTRAGRRLSLGAIYSTLYRLEEKGMVSSRRGSPSPERGGRAKRLFALEREGARVLEATRATLERLWEGLDLRPGEASS